MSLPVTEDTPPDMLAGSMDLKVILPDGQSVKMNVQRSTPMMDLLIQATTSHCLSPGDFSLQAMGDKGVLPFKPSTPIGALDTFTVKIVEKKSHSRGRAPQVPQSFLNTFRLQVHLPRSQLFVLRVTPDVTLSEIMTHVCTEKNLNLEKYEFRNPGNLEEVLELDKTLGDYKLQELSMMSKGNRTVTGLMSSADIINVKSSKHRQNSVCDSSLSSGSFGSRSCSPIPAINVVSMPPQPPIRKKRRPAPKPPTFTENEKRDQTAGSVLISHSRESSDSSGYHEASVLSESPTHGSPAGTMENDSPPDTLPRRSKLPPSQSFTNLTSIQPAPRARLTSSVSNTSLNSNGHSRKKRAPPPPPTQAAREDRIKSSTLPTSVAEERRNGSSFMSESTFRHFEADVPVEVSETKVQIPVEITSELVNETKASKDEIPASLDVDVRVPPKPKPRTMLPKEEAAAAGSSSSSEAPHKSRCSLVGKELRDENGEDGSRRSDPFNRWKNVESPNGEETPGKKNSEEFSSEGSMNSPEDGRSVEKSQEVVNNAEAVKSSLLVGDSGTVEDPRPEEAQDQTDHDSINWEYQLPPPPTDFRDTNSPACTEFGTITITPEILENMGEYKNESDERFSKKQDSSISQTQPKTKTHETPRKSTGSENKNHHHYKSSSEKKISQSKSDVMNELTNILNENRKCKEKSLSVSNLYINDSIAKDSKKNALNYSRSFSTEPVSSLENFKLTTYQENGLGNNRKLSSSNEMVYDNEITYRNYKNLEKSSSLECIQVNHSESQSKFIERTEEAFRKPVAPVQKKLKMAKRSASSIGVNTVNSQKRNTSDATDSWADDANINVLRQQFLEFLKEKKLMNNDLNMKSLDVIRNILPELKVEKEEKNHSLSQANVVLSKERNSQGNAQSEEKVKIVDVKVKNSPPAADVSEEVVLRHEPKREPVAESKSPREKVPKEEVKKRYSYQGPPSINFGTWGERPKTTRIIIKDEDYVTQEKISEKKSEMVQQSVARNGEASTNPKPKEVRKPAQIVIKKPGVLSHYEMFSALPRRKEISSLELVHMEDEERKKRMDKSEAKEFNRVPIVCGVELKKEFKSSGSPQNPSRFSSPEPEPHAQAETIKPKHSVSVYVNGNQETIDRDRITSSKPCYSFIVPKRNSTLMPVVKGFRGFSPEENGTSQVNLNNSCTGSHTNIKISSRRETSNENGTVPNSSPSKRQTNGTIPPPPPPNISLVKLKPVSFGGTGKQKPISQDPRGQLLDEIRNFGGLRQLKKSTVH